MDVSQRERRLVEDDVAAGKLHLVIHAATATHEGPQAREQLFGEKRFDEVVVGSAVESLHLVLELSSGGEHENGGGDALASQGARDGKAVGAGQHHVEDEGIVDVCLGCQQRLGAIGEPIGVIAFLA